MKNKIFVGLAALIVIAGIVALLKNQAITIGNTSSGLVISNDSISVKVDGNIAQTIKLNEEAKFAITQLPPEAKIQKFITDKDVNFDGSNDIGVFTSTGYMGVNNYYDFYVYSSTTKLFEKSGALAEISNPAIDPSKKQVTSSYKSGPSWYTDVFQFDGIGFVKTSK